MVCIEILTRTEMIERGIIPGLKVTGKPGETIRELWGEFIQKGGPRTDPTYYQRTHPIKCKLEQMYQNTMDYIRGKLGIEEIDPRDEILD